MRAAGVDLVTVGVFAWSRLEPAPGRHTLDWLDRVLEPLRDLPAERKQRLRLALALTLGVESILVMKDVCRVDDDEALDVLRWTAAAVLRAALDEGESPGS